MRCDCLFVLAGAPREEAEGAAGRVARWMEPLAPRAHSLWLEDIGVLVGACGSSTAGGGALREVLHVWGEAPPAALSEARAVLDADDHELRRLDRSSALLAVGEDRVRLVAGATGPQALYRADASAAVTAWATSAVAAALLSRPVAEVRLEPAHLPQLFAFGCVGGRATHLAGVSAVDSTTVVDFRSARPPEARSYWPSAERWAPVPEEEAAALADEALLRSLDARLRGVPGAYLGLTGGLDSAAVAVALAELGVSVQAMTWGASGHPDVDGARRLAAHLGLPHVVLGGGWHEGSPDPVTFDLEARWHEGLYAPPLLGRPPWPADLATFATGGGGETGRAFHYRGLAQLDPQPSLGGIAAVWRPEEAVGSASPSARAAIRDAKLAFLAEAAATGHEGWRLLDVVYAEQRFRRWGRGILPRGPEQVVAAFSDPELQRALVGLPLPDRLFDGWHRRFIARRAPELVPPPPSAPRRGVPRVLRRVAAHVRAHRAAPGARHHYADALVARPAVREWLLTEALGVPAVAAAMGTPWVDEVRRGMLAGRARETEHALVAAGLASLEAALRRQGRRLD